MKHLILISLLALAACGGSDEPIAAADQPASAPGAALPCQIDRTCL